MLRIDKLDFDSNRVPVLIYWKTQKIKQAFVREVINITNYRHFTQIEGYSCVKVEAGVFKRDPKTKTSVRFENKEEKTAFLRHLYELGDDCNMYIACPDDVPYNVISNWINKSLPEMGIKPTTAIEITD